MTDRPVPQHVAIIMDGNGRWAERRGHRRVFGHIRGASRVKPIVRRATDLGIQALTLFTFSTENWERPTGELNVLWKLFKKYLQREVEELSRRNVRIRFIGEVEKLAPDVREVMRVSEERLRANTGLQLIFAISYGGRREIVQAAQKFAQDCVDGKTSPAEMNEAKLSQYLWTRELGALANVDFVIRTSGEQRISNFLLWQAAYAEFYFTDLCWPDFDDHAFEDAIRVYSERDRRFGGLKAKSKDRVESPLKWARK